jgi:hypothetical protein
MISADAPDRLGQGLPGLGVGNGIHIVQDTVQAAGLSSPVSSQAKARTENSPGPRHRAKIETRNPKSEGNRKTQERNDRNWARHPASGI